MENRRARRRSQAHPPRRDPPLDAFESQRAQRDVDWQQLDDAYERMSGAETLLYRRWQEQTGADHPGTDPVGQLLSHPIRPENDDYALWLLGLGEKVAALGGQLEVRAVFDTEQITLLREPGPDQQPPILGDAGELSELTALERFEMSPEDPDAVLDVELTEAERHLILTGLSEWGGAAAPTDELAIAMGFADVEDLMTESKRLIDAVVHLQALTPDDWKRLLITTEIAFASDYFGVGCEWETVGGDGDWASLLALRGLQDKLIGIATRAQPPTRPRAADPPDQPAT